MRCKRYRRLLHLNRSGEISRKEAEDLRQHLRLCEKCSLEYQRIVRADGFVHRLGSFAPVPKNPEKLTSDILRRVRAGTAVPHTINPIDRILDFFTLPGVRYATIVCVLLIPAVFFSQFLSMMGDISALEERMSGPTLRGGAAEATYTVESKTLQEVVKSESAKPVTGTMSYTMTDGHITVRATEVESILSIYNLKNLTTLVGSSMLRLDSKTVEKIINEVKATAELTFQFGHEGA